METRRHGRPCTVACRVSTTDEHGGRTVSRTDGARHVSTTASTAARTARTAEVRSTSSLRALTRNRPYKRMLRP
jgi:hypothetical protein